MFIKDAELLQDLNCLDMNYKKTLITTINAHSYNIALMDAYFSEALKNSDVLLPDGYSIVLAKNILNGSRIRRIAGADLFEYEMKFLNKKGGKCFFLGSSNIVLGRIRERVITDYSNITIDTYSPSYNIDFSEEENNDIISKINKFNPDLLWIGMTAPKQEKWAYQNFDKITASCHIGCIGAAFDFYSGSISRAPRWVQDIGFEWLFRLLSNPKRLWRRYLIGNIKFIVNVFKEKFNIL